MGFRMLDVLTLAEAKNEHVMLVPTKKYFKPVLVLTAPLTVDTARLIGADWAFDSMGNPQSFEGSIKLTIELTRATVAVVGEVSGEVSVVSEVVKTFSVFRQEKTGVRLRLRVHLPEDRAQLLELLDFMSNLNKEPFTVTVSPDSLFTSVESEGAPVRSGSTPIEHKMNITKGKKTLVVGKLTTQPTAGGFVAAWEIKAVALQGAPADGSAITEDSQVFGREPDALAWAGSEMMSCLKYTLKPDSLDEVKAVGQAVDWLVEKVPSLRKAEPGAEAVH